MTQPDPRPRLRAIDPTAWSTRRRISAGIVSGLLLGLSFPPLNAGWTAPLTLGIFAFSLVGARRHASVLTGAAFGVAFMGPLVYWLWISAGVLAWFGVMVLQVAFFAVAGWGCARAWRSRAPYLAIPAAWTAIELVRSRMPMGGFTWGDVGLTQIDTPLSAYAPFGGVHLVGAAVMVLAVVLAEITMAPRGGWRRASIVAAVVLVLAVVLPTPGLADAGSFDVASVQGNVPRDRFRIGRGREGPEDEVIVRNHLRATDTLIGSAAPDLVIWPENSFDRDPRDYPDLFEPTKALIARVGAPFLIGAILDAGEGFTNSNLHIATDGTIIGRYDKTHLVPFGEYVPAEIFRKLVPILDEEIPRNGEPGRDIVVFDIGGTKVGSVICFESAYPALVRRFVSGGAQMMVVTTNNAAFGDTTAAAQHLRQSRMRAIENGRSVVHSAIAGISALIAPDGTVVESAPLFTRDVLRAAMPLRSGQTPYTRWGSGLEAFMLVAGLFAAAKPRRA